MKKKEEYVYKDLHINMSNKAMANVLYAGIMTDSAFTILWTMAGKEYDRTQNSRNGCSIKVHIHPDNIKLFEMIALHQLETPESVTI